MVLEDGKVVQDSGPIVETNTTEDTDKQESETTEVSGFKNCVLIDVQGTDKYVGHKL